MGAGAVKTRGFAARHFFGQGPGLFQIGFIPHADGQIDLAYRAEIMHHFADNFVIGNDYL